MRQSWFRPGELREWLERTGLTRKRAIEKVNNILEPKGDWISERTFQRWMAGKAQPYPSHLTALLQVRRNEEFYTFWLQALRNRGWPGDYLLARQELEMNRPDKVVLVQVLNDDRQPDCDHYFIGFQGPVPVSPEDNWCYKSRRRNLLFYLGVEKTPATEILELRYHPDY